MRLVLTRPAHDAERTTQALRARGHDVLVAPLLLVEPHADLDLGPGPWSAVAMTSANAAHALAAHPLLSSLRALPVFVVGRRTAEAARSAGFDDVRSADGDAGDLARLVAAELAGAHDPILYAAGEDRARDLAADLSPFGLTAVTIAVYRARAVSGLPPSLRQALVAGEVDGVLHFSRRTADIYVKRSRDADVLDRALLPRHFCLSAQVAEPLAAAGAARIYVASRPDEATLMAVVG